MLEIDANQARAMTAANRGEHFVGLFEKWANAAIMDAARTGLSVARVPCDWDRIQRALTPADKEVRTGAMPPDTLPAATEKFLHELKKNGFAVTTKWVEHDEPVWEIRWD